MLTKKWDKTILAVLPQWDYGEKERGISLEKVFFLDNLRKLAGRVEPLWSDDYLRDKEQLQKDILAKSRELKPDLIFFATYTDQVSYETLDALKQEFTTFGWFGDDPWRFDGYSSGYAPHYTFVATTDPWAVAKYRKIGIEPILTQWAAQPFAECLGLLPEDETYEYDVSFVGGGNKFRNWFIHRLENEGVKVECFGAGWPNGRVTFEKMEQIFRRSRINLNISNSISHDIRFVMSGPKVLLHYLRSPKRAEQIKARNFEIPLAGGFQLTNYVLGLERYLRIGDEVAVYSSPEECAQQIRYYLENEDERRAISATGYARASREHTFMHRMELILGHIWR